MTVSRAIAGCSDHLSVARYVALQAAITLKVALALKTGHQDSKTYCRRVLL